MRQRKRERESESERERESESESESESQSERERERERDHAEARSQDGSNFTTRIHNCDPLNTQAANKSSSGLMMSRFIASHLLS